MEYRKCRDFGEIVFNLVEHGILGRTENDSLEDFENGYEFATAFNEPFLPNRRKTPLPNQIKSIILLRIVDRVEISATKPIAL